MICRRCGGLVQDQLCLGCGFLAPLCACRVSTAGGWRAPAIFTCPDQPEIPRGTIWDGLGVS